MKYCAFVFFDLVHVSFLQLSIKGSNAGLSMEMFPHTGEVWILALTSG